MEYISNFFHFYETIDSFEAHKKQNVINPDSICFIKESSQIYTQGTLFGICKSRFESIENMVKEHETILKNILGDAGPSVPTPAIDNLKDIIEFLSGFTTDDNLKVIVENMIETVKTEVSVITAELSQKVDSVIDTVNGLQPQIDSLRANITAQNSVIELINNRTDATQKTVTLLQTSFESLRTYVNGVSDNVDNRLAQMEATIGSMNSMINDINTDIMQIEEFMSDIRDDISSSATNSAEALRVATEANQKSTELMNSKGQPGGIAPVNDLGKIPDNFIPEWANSVQMEESYTYFPSIGENNILYIDTTTKVQYRWDGTKYDILYDPSTLQTAVTDIQSSITDVTSLVTTESNRAKESEALLEESIDDVVSTVTTLDNKIGANGGIATLDDSGKVPSSQLPSYVDDVVDVYVKENDDKSVTLYLDEELTQEVTPEAGKIYVSIGTSHPNEEYRWSGTTYVSLGNPVVIGTVAGTAFDGGRGRNLEKLLTDARCRIVFPRERNRRMAFSLGKNLDSQDLDITCQLTTTSNYSEFHYNIGQVYNEDYTNLYPLNSGAVVSSSVTFAVPVVINPGSVGNMKNLVLFGSNTNSGFVATGNFDGLYVTLSSSKKVTASSSGGIDPYLVGIHFLSSDTTLTISKRYNPLLYKGAPSITIDVMQSPDESGPIEFPLNYKDDHIYIRKGEDVVVPKYASPSVTFEGEDASSVGTAPTVCINLRFADRICTVVGQVPQDGSRFIGTGTILEEDNVYFVELIANVSNNDTYDSLNFTANERASIAEPGIHITRISRSSISDSVHVTKITYKTKDAITTLYNMIQRWKSRGRDAGIVPEVIFMDDIVYTDVYISGIRDEPEWTVLASGITGLEGRVPILYTFGVTFDPNTLIATEGSWDKSRTPIISGVCLINLRTDSIVEEDVFVPLTGNDPSEFKDYIQNGNISDIHFNLNPAHSISTTSSDGKTNIFLYFTENDESVYPSYVEYTIKIIVDSVNSFANPTAYIRKHTFNYILPQK